MLHLGEWPWKPGGWMQVKNDTITKKNHGSDNYFISSDPADLS